MTVISIKIAGAFASALMLTACGGGGGGGSDTAITPGSPFALVVAGVSAERGTNLYYVQLEEEFEAAIDDTDLPYQVPTTLPTAGSANYLGMMELTALLPDRQADLRGEMSLDVAFADDTISGSVYDMVIEEDDGITSVVTPASGTLAIANGTIDRTVDISTDYAFEADVFGTISADGDSAEVDATMFGNFFEDQTYVRGDVFGTVTNVDGTLPLDDGDFFGAQN